MIGLIEAINRFNPQKGKFSTYAVWWIRQVISREVKQAEPLIRLPEHIVTEKKRFNIFLEEGGGRDIPECLGFSAKKAKLLEGIISARTIYFSTPISQRNPCGGMVGDFISAPSRGLEEIAHFAFVRRRLKAKLPPWDYEILSRTFGLDGKGQRTLEEVGRELQMKKNTVFMARDRAMKRARKIMKYAGINSAHF